MTDHLFELSAGKDVKMAHNFKSSCENNAWKNSDFSVIRTQLTTAIPVQCSANWAIKPTGSSSRCEFVNSEE